MTSDRFFVRKDQIRLPAAVLDGAEHHHLARVARIKQGDRIWLFDEEGRSYSALVQKVGSGCTQLEILESTPAVPTRNRISLAFSLLKTKALEWILQKGTELGTHSFIPLITARSVLHLQDDDVVAKKLERWGRILREASKQSGRAQVPLLQPPISLSEFLRDQVHADWRLFLYEGAGVTLKEIIRNRMILPELKQADWEREALILVGPEGGWTKEEAEDILKRGFEAVSLGDLVLRAETAAISMLAVMTQLWI